MASESRPRSTTKPKLAVVKKHSIPWDDVQVAFHVTPEPGGKAASYTPDVVHMDVNSKSLPEGWRCIDAEFTSSIRPGVVLDWRITFRVIGPVNVRDAAIVRVALNRLFK
jgi:hypothetical protein